MIFCMHSINALFLLGDTSLNCMVSLGFSSLWFVYMVLICIISLSSFFLIFWPCNKFKNSNWHFFILNTCRDFQCFDLHILSCGRLLLSFFSGSSMFVFHFGKTVYPLFYNFFIQQSGAFYNLITFVTGGLILSLIYHPRMHPYGMFLNPICHIVTIAEMIVFSLLHKVEHI